MKFLDLKNDNVNACPFPAVFSTSAEQVPAGGFRALMGCLIVSMLIALPCAASEEPQELVELNDAYQRAQERALEPLKVTYLSQLRLLLEKLTKQGKLDDALMVKNKLEGVEEGPKAHPEEPVKKVKAQKGVSMLEINAAQGLLGEWIVNHKPDDVLIFDEKKNATYRNEKAEWSLTLTFTANFKDKRIIIRPNEKTDEIIASTFDDATKVSTPIILTRKKK